MTEEETLRKSNLLAYSSFKPVLTDTRPVDCNLILKKSKEAFTSSLTEKELVLSADPLPTVQANEEQFSLVFRNLLSNAIKFTPKRPILVHFGLERGMRDYILSVGDNGLGFDPKTVGTMFTPFERFHKENYPGAGLGLAICKWIIELHGGRIWANSTPGKGSTFYFSIPRAQRT